MTGSAPCERDVRDRLFRFYDWCAANDDIPELLTLARTIFRWENEITAAVLTAVSNARSESLNRIAKLEARLAYSFRNSASQRRRVRTACTRGAGRSQAATARRSTPGDRPETRSGLTSKTPGQDAGAVRGQRARDRRARAMVTAAPNRASAPARTISSGPRVCGWPGRRVKQR